MVRKALSKFKREFNRAINTAIIAAFGFLIALTWKDLIAEIVDKLAAYSPMSGQIIETIIITAISIIGIIIVTKIFSKKEEGKKD